ncbi:d20dede0-1b8e-4e7e-8155-e5adec97339b [Sclerotinia trifoliorum]|uniref:D20dede0-1b8e-4e7e-8155-e5adec97339b n=1 Tax=Sclerotinia trifoliorum TaxID=28548 RepID=A0A8H2W6M2_9HELO|nr:d20dede0-1b8e-4e7e-8155-e5adec97339b [Sclerotinia trifoliorum]
MNTYNNAVSTYTGDNPVEFVHSSMGKASKDLFGGETASRKRPAKFMHNDFGGQIAFDDDVSEYNDDNPDNRMDYRGDPDNGYER